MTTHHVQKLKHEHFPLVKYVLVSFLAVLLTGLGLDVCLLSFLQYQISVNKIDEELSTTWKHFESHGDVELSRKRIPGTDLYAYRGVSTIELPLDAILDVFHDTKRSVFWVKDLIEVEEFPPTKKTERVTYKHGKKVEKAILRRRYQVPIPGVADREFLLKRLVSTDNVHRSATVKYVSFEDDEAFPPCVGCVRGLNLGSTWEFKAVDGADRTWVKSEIVVDPNLTSLSPFFVNNFQKHWPVVTMHGLFKTTRHDLGRDNDMQFPNIFYGLFPLWR